MRSSKVLRVKKPEYRRLLRKRLGLNQQQLAVLMKCSDRWVRYHESGERNSRAYDRSLNSLYLKLTQKHKHDATAQHIAGLAR